MIIAKYNEVINFLSFTRRLRILRSKINIRIDAPEIIEDFPDSHPRGFIKEFRKRRTTIAETYLRITKNLDSLNHKERIRALKLLSEHILYSRSLKMPLNAARVQLALMKQVVKNRDNKRLQLELMKDFSESSFGHPRSIKKFLKKLDIIEVPETGQELRDLNMGWDFHVHDNASYGRKSPIQLVIDAFIKGISELTVAYNNLDSEDSVKEVLEAGRILGIKVNIAIEFSAMSNARQYHFMYILPEFSSRKKKFVRFLKQRSQHFDAFMHELGENQKKRLQNINYLIDRFNKEYLPGINDGYEKNSIYYLKPLRLPKNDPQVKQNIRSRRQLGEYLYPHLKTIYERRIMQAGALRTLALKSPGQFTTTELRQATRQYEKLQKDYSVLDPERIRLKYFADNELIKAETAVSSLEEIYILAKKAGGKIKFIQPLEHGLEAAINMVIDNYEFISLSEIYNIFDSIEAGDSDFISFSTFIRHFNDHNIEGIDELLRSLNIKIDKMKLAKVSRHSGTRRISPSIGSDATGRSTIAPGMGFIFENRLARHQRKSFLKKHYRLPSEVSNLIREQYRHFAGKGRTKKLSRIVCLGKINKPSKKEPVLEKREKPISLLKAIEYINPGLKSLVLIIIGFLPAYFTVGVEYALLWFAITGTRNIIVDMISASGFKPSEWSFKDINFSNLANSLFWTGFSVPILGFVKSRFDVIWQWDHQGGSYEFAKFFFINTANGIYLASHNYLRGFDKGTIRGNFFRSIIAWPFSALFAPLGNALLLPSIVQAKFWSDFVAAIIEGSAKYRNIIRIKERVIKSLFPDLSGDNDETEILAVLDIMYMFRESPRVKTVIKKQLQENNGLRERLVRRLSIRKKPAPANGQAEHLLSWFNSREKFERLCSYVIRNYNSEHGSYLLNLISTAYPEVSRWIVRIGNNKRK